MDITAHMVVKNEDIWVWFAIQSVLPYVKEIFITVNGSTDKSLEIIKNIDSPKIKLEVVGAVDREGLVEIRRQQLEKTRTDWFLIVDADEIWPKQQIEKLIKCAKNADQDVAAIICRNRNCVGDVYHYLPDNVGQYQLAGIKGNITIRLIRKTKNLKIEGEYPLEAYIDDQGEISKQDNRLKFCDCWYLHTTFLKRSSQVIDKTSGSLGKSKIWERGILMDIKELPEVLFDKNSVQVSKPLINRGFLYEVMAVIISPLLKIKRLIR